MNRHSFTRIHLSEHGFNIPKNIRNSFNPRKSIQQLTAHDPNGSRCCQNLLLAIVIIQLILIIGICVTSQLFPNVICKVFMNCQVGSNSSTNQEFNEHFRSSIIPSFVTPINASIKSNCANKGKFKYAPDDIDSSLLVLKMSGQWKFWDKSGNLLVKTSYSPYRIQAESLYGKYKERYDSGKLKLTGEYHKGSKIGTWKYFYENGQIRSIKYYQYKADSNSKDYPIGVWSFFSTEGNLTKKEM